MFATVAAPSSSTTRRVTAVKWYGDTLVFDNWFDVDEYIDSNHDIINDIEYGYASVYAAYTDGENIWHASAFDNDPTEAHTAVIDMCAPNSDDYIIIHDNKDFINCIVDICHEFADIYERMSIDENNSGDDMTDAKYQVYTDFIAAVCSNPTVKHYIDDEFNTAAVETYADMTYTVRFAW